VIISRFQWVQTSNLINSPNSYEGKEITFNERVKSIVFNVTSSYYILETYHGLILRITSIHGLDKEVLTNFRGKSLLISLGFINVYDFQVKNNNSIILSIPGIIAFIIMFLRIFRIDMKNLTFSQRRDKNT
jgi:hypothetical protein